MILRFVILFSAFFVYSQAIKAQQFTGKIIAGVNGGQIDGDGLSGFHRPGLLVGFGAAFQLDEHWSLGPEFLYSGKGAQVTLDDIEKGVYQFALKYKLNYFDVPILATYKVRNSFRIMGGLAVNYLLSAEIDPGTIQEPYNARDFFSPVDFMILAGMEYEIFDNIWLQGRWSYSLVGVNSKGPTNYPTQLTGRQSGGFFNNVLQFSLRFDLHKDVKHADPETGTKP
jgi:opacity protein-like surface antigen